MSLNTLLHCSLQNSTVKISTKNPKLLKWPLSAPAIIPKRFYSNWKKKKKTTIKVKCLSLLRTGNKRICGLLIHGIKQNKYWRGNSAFSVCVLLLTKLKAKLLLCDELASSCPPLRPSPRNLFFGLVFFGFVFCFFLNHYKWAWDFGVFPAARHHSLTEIQLKQFSLTLKLPDHVAAVASWRCTNIDTQIQHTDKEVVYGEPQTERATRHLQLFLLPSINLVDLWLFSFFKKTKQTKKQVSVLFANA